MAASESDSITVSRRGSAPEDRDSGCTVVWLRGEHDIATKVPVVLAIARAAQRDPADLVVDMSEVTFIDASTLGALVGSRNRLRAREQSLTVRAPSPRVCRLLRLCGLTGLVRGEHGGAGAALGTWVDVPAAGSLSPEGAGAGVVAGRQSIRAGPGAAQGAGADAIVEAGRRAL